MLSYFAVAPILIAILLYLVPFEKAARIIAIVTQTALFGFAFYVFMLCKEGDIVARVGNFEWFMGIIIRIDTLSSVFLMLTSFIFLVATIYSFNGGFSRLFWFLLFVWQGLLNSIFISNDIFNIFVLVEVVTVVVAVLIMYNRDNRSMYDGMVYLMIDIVAMQFYLFGAGYVYKLTGTLDMTAAAQVMAGLDKSSLLLPFALIMTALSLKCALTPLFSWLPKAHGTPSAPAAVSAVLSGMHIKCGIYLFIRFQSVFAEISMSEFFLIVGVITGITGAVFALSQTDVKLILSYSTISQVGMIMIGLNVADVYSYTGSVYHIFNHALFKSALFMCAGAIVHMYGTRDINQIRGVLRRYPLVGVATIMAILGIIGTPFFNGSISKYFITPEANWAVRGPIILINLGTIIVFMKFSTMLFGRAEGFHEHEKMDGFKQTAILALGILCLAGGVFGEQFIEFLFNIEVNVDAAGYLEKTGLFVLSVIAGYFIFRYFVDKHPFFKKIRGFDMSFRWMCASIGGFFAVILIVTRLFAV